VSELEDARALVPRALRFRDRRDAGRRLAARLERLREERPVVLGMPRGGMPVAAEVARALGAQLDVAVVRKLGAPRNPEFAIGAVAEGGVHVLGDEAVRKLGISESALQELTAHAEDELAEELGRYRGEREPVPLAGRTAILVDDGLATGRSALAAIRSLRIRGAARVILAVPVAAGESVAALREEVEEVVCVKMPREMWAVGFWYEDFTAIGDEEVAALLAS
jgi:putative phosphoribosyl transferase